MDARNGTSRRKAAGAIALGALGTRVIEPALLRRAGLNVAIAANWPAIVGASLAAETRPERVRWARRAHAGEAAAPGTLVVACSGATALRVQHEADQIVERVNAVFGRAVIGALRIEQRPIEPPRPPRRPREATAEERERVDALTRAVEHERLRGALTRLGERVAVAAGAGARSLPREGPSASTSPSNLHPHTIAEGHERAWGEDPASPQGPATSRPGHAPSQTIEPTTARSTP